tara:strand:- start:16 stop:201 length:186 start_codon:yes stop_codon:yes gene_type:complete
LPNSIPENRHCDLGFKKVFFADDHEIPLHGSVVEKGKGVPFSKVDHCFLGILEIKLFGFIL